MQIPKSGSRNKKKVLIISQYFWPENFRINEIVKFLRSKNYYVTVITGLPNYPNGKLFKEFSQNTEYFSKYCGAEIIRVPIILRERSTKINLFLNYLSFNFSSIFFSFFKIRKRKYDIIFTFGTSPVTVSLTSIFYRNYFKAKHVLWLLDVWPEIIFELKILKNIKTDIVEKSNLMDSKAGMVRVYLNNSKQEWDRDPLKYWIIVLGMIFIDFLVLIYFKCLITIH